MTKRDEITGMLYESRCFWQPAKPAEMDQEQYLAEQERLQKALEDVRGKLEELQKPKPVGFVYPNRKL